MSSRNLTPFRHTVTRRDLNLSSPRACRAKPPRAFEQALRRFELRTLGALIRDCRAGANPTGPNPTLPQAQANATP